MRNIHSATLGIALLVQLFLPVNIGSAPRRQGPSATSEMESGVELLHRCSNTILLADGNTNLTPLQLMSGTACASYLGGFMDGYLLGVNQAPSKAICFPSTGISTEEAARIVDKWLRGHPERLHEQDRFLVALAFAQAFPCK